MYQTDEFNRRSKKYRSQYFYALGHLLRGIKDDSKKTSKEILHHPNGVDRTDKIVCLDDKK